MCRRGVWVSIPAPGNYLRRVDLLRRLALAGRSFTAMNKDEATQIVRQELAKYRTRPYVELSRLVGTRLPTRVIKGPSGAEYQVAIQIRWDGKADGDIRVVGSIDDAGWRAFVPLSEDFITSPNDVISATW